MVLYLDLLFFQNMVVGYLILYLVKTDLYPGISLRRVIMGALLSSITYIFWYGMKMQSNRGITLLAACFFMSFILVWTFHVSSFHLYKKTIMRWMTYLFLIGGACLLFRDNFAGKEISDSRWCWESTGYMIIFTAIYTRWKRRDRKATQFEEMIYDVEIQRHSKSIFLRGFYDSGNLLVSRITGRGICVIALEDIKELLDEAEIKLLTDSVDDQCFSWEMLMKNIKSGIYVIQYSSVGKENGGMPGILADHIIVKKEDKILVDIGGMLGISAQRISKDGRFGVLLPADIFI